MKKSKLIMIIGLLNILIINTIFAQENYSPKSGTLGINGGFGYSAPFLGVIYHLLDNLTINPDFMFSYSNPEAEDKKNQVKKDLTNLGYGFEMNVKYYIPLDINFYLTAGPSVSYTYQKYESFYDYLNCYRSIYKTYGFYLNAGLMYLFNKHFGVFITGYIGIEYQKNNEINSHSDNTISRDTETRSTKFSIGKGALGFLFYF